MEIKPLPDEGCENCGAYESFDISEQRKNLILFGETWLCIKCLEEIVFEKDEELFFDVIAGKNKLRRPAFME